jgi:hypothetical protein
VDADASVAASSRASFILRYYLLNERERERESLWIGVG